jgi:hypothetical protein
MRNGRLRFSLDAVPADLRGALPLVEELANAKWPHDFTFATVEQVEPDVREEIKAARAQLSQGLPLARRWLVVRRREPYKPERRLALVHPWEIRRDHELRVVSVYFSEEVLEAQQGLPPDVAEARDTQGRSTVRATLSADEPPDLLSVTTYGIATHLP